MSFTSGSDAFVGSLISDPELDALFSVEADIQAMLRFEVALANAQAKLGIITTEAADAISNAAKHFAPDYETLRTAFQSDGVVPPLMIRQFKALLDDDIAASFHLGATSQDLVDSSLMIRLSESATIMQKRMGELQETLDQMASESSNAQTLKSRTRMQVALPISVSQKLAGWQSNLAAAKTSSPNTCPLQLGGPDGTASSFGEHYLEVARMMAEELGLEVPDHHWQTNRKPLLDIANWFGSVAIGLGKIAQDILVMSQNEIGEVKLAGSGGSSSMAHKQNPVAAEMIVAQARFCQTQLNGLNFAAIHENERSGTAMTLEWMLLPQLVLCCGSMLLKSNDMLGSLTFVE